MHNRRTFFGWLAATLFAGKVASAVEPEAAVVGEPPIVPEGLTLSVEKLRLEPGDTLVIRTNLATVDAMACAEFAARELLDRLGLAGNVQVVLVGPGFDLSALPDSKP